MQLIIGNHNYSTWSMRPWLFVHHHRLPVEVLKLNLFSPELRAKLAEHFSDGKVPLLIDGELDVWDSIAILEYLGERFPHTVPWPVDPSARAVARAISAEMHSSFSALRNEAPMNCRKRFPGYRLSAGARRDVARIEEIWNHCRTVYGSGGPWLFGDFSIADAMYAPVVMRFRSIEVELDDAAIEYCATVNRSDSVRQWLKLAMAEKEVVEEDEIDWAGELIDR